ncbi:CehA/McbA family metallohydrolase, partial [bacterium]|nr:CehA/McbA family metallohydrolase [bacterium]
MHYRFEGNLVARDCKRHIPHQMTVPGRASQIEIDFRFKPHSVGEIANMLTLTVFDPNGFRGAGHRGGASHRVRIGPVMASPGYIPGPLPDGEWTVQLDTHRIMPGDAVDYEMDVHIIEGENGKGEGGSLRKTSVPVKPKRGPGWYWGDLHSHTHHSDAGGRTVAELVQTARDHALDFIFLTDHNTTAGLEEMYALTTEDLLTAGGMELTTFWGHALCLGTRDWVDWRVRPGTGAMDRIATNAYAREQVFIIAHPQAIGDPLCTGCTWLFGEVMPGNAKLVEIWNEW